MTRALEGLKIIELGQGLSAPFAAKLLSDMGAEVIKLERPVTGDVSRAYGPFAGDLPDPEKSGAFHYLNAGKKSVTLDVSICAGLDVLNKLCAEADVLLINGDVAQIESLKLTWEDLAPRFPRLIVTTITPFGFTGRLRGVRAHDLTICALGAVTIAVGEAGKPPLTPPLCLSDYQSAVAAASATMLALFAREDTGRGQHVDISPLDVWATVHQGSGFTNLVNFGKSRSRAGRRRVETYPFHFLEASDGPICLIARDGHQWKRFVELVGARELLDNPRYQDRMAMGMRYPAEVDAILQPWFSQRTREEIFALCRMHHIPFAPVRRVDEVAQCKQLAAREFFVQLPARTDGTSFRVPGAPYRMSSTPPVIRTPAPLLGEHTDAVLKGLGYGAKALATFRQAGVL